MSPILYLYPLDVGSRALLNPLEIRLQDEEKPYLICIQNYDTATVQTCREAVARALRKMANDRTLLQDQVDMRTFQ